MAVIGERKHRVKIADLEIDETAYVTPWSVSFFQEKAYINISHPISYEQDHSFSMKVTRTGHGKGDYDIFISDVEYTWPDLRTLPAGNFVKLTDLTADQMKDDGLELLLSLKSVAHLVDLGFETKSVEELTGYMNKAVENELYEAAGMFRTMVDAKKQPTNE